MGGGRDSIPPWEQGAESSSPSWPCAAAAAGTISAGAAHGGRHRSPSPSSRASTSSRSSTPPAGTDLELVDGSDAVVGTGTDRRQRRPAVARPDRRQLHGAHDRGPGVTESDPVTVSDFSDPAPDQSFYDGQTLVDGFGYLTTRDGTTLSVNVVLPGHGDAGPVPDGRRVLRLRPEQPRQHARSAQLFNAARLRLRRREHPRHRLLGRLVPHLRADPEPRRLRRDRDRRRAAVGRSSTRSAWSASPTPASASCSSPRTQPPQPGRDHAAVGHRRHLPRHALPRRHPQHRLRRAVGRASARTQAAPYGQGWAQAARRRRRHRPAPTTSCCGCRTPTCSR